MQVPHERLILASQSPRRRELMTEAGLAFEVIAPHESAECGVCSRETPPELVARLAFQKGRDVAERIESGLIVACDTVAECRGHILGKPKNRRHAREMLRLLRGTEHRVYSGLCLWRRPDNRLRTRVDVTVLRMDDLSDEQLTEYLDSNAWEGKAGAFGYQDRVGWLHVVEGSESNVVGLPMELLETMFAEFAD
ncbi:MAG: nucleoside triphosphate pyrophosphatase [Pirellulaceae bacterium]